MSIPYMQGLIVIPKPANNYLIFVQFTVRKLLFTFILESNNDETDENVDHEEGDDDNVYHVEDCDEWSVVKKRPVVF